MCFFSSFSDFVSTRTDSHPSSVWQILLSFNSLNLFFSYLRVYTVIDEIKSFSFVYKLIIRCPFSTKLTTSHWLSLSEKLIREMIFSSLQGILMCLSLQLEIFRVEEQFSLSKFIYCWSIIAGVLPIMRRQLNIVPTTPAPRFPTTNSHFYFVQVLLHEFYFYTYSFNPKVIMP